LLHQPNTFIMNDIERQIKLEADARHDGVLRYAKSREYQLATDLKPAKDLVANALSSLGDPILQEQMGLNTSQRRRLPEWATALASIRHDKLALITISTMLNSICSSEFHDGLPPRRTPLSYELGQWCRIERMLDCFQKREVDLVQALLPRNRGRNAGRRAAELARKHSDEDDWAKHYRSYHLGEKLISLAIQFARFDGQPIFEAITVREGSGKKRKRRNGLRSHRRPPIGSPIIRPRCRRCRLQFTCRWWFHRVHGRRIPQTAAISFFP